MPRITRIAGSFLIVVTTYWAYALAVVPWIEPAADLRRGEGADVPIPGEGDDPTATSMRGFQSLFPPGSWELKDPKVLESDRAKLLLQNYKNCSDGTVEIHPCTIVIAHEGPAKDEAERLRQTVILEAPGGAILQFDQPIDINRAKIGRMVKGQLIGPVTIRSDWKDPGSADDLLIVTSDIQLTEKTISTQKPVDFRWGSHFGRGQDMMISLLTGPPKPNADMPGPNVTGIKWFELRHVERLHLELGQAAVAPNEKPVDAPVEITCKGPFRFDAIDRVATFRDRVDVMKINPAGPSDQISCEVLSLFFTKPPVKKNKNKFVKEIASSANTPNSLDMTAERIEAVGNPVVVTAPSQQVVARGMRLQYNLIAKSIAMDGGQEVFLQQGSREIHAGSLYYQASAEPGRIGRVVAQGPGWLRGDSPDRPGQSFEAIWKKQLRVSPEGNNKQVVSLTGGAELRYQGVGQLQAKEIYFWLSELPPAAKGQQSQLRPDRMMARADVHMNSTQISSQVEQLEVWFEEKPNGGPLSAVTGPGTANQGAERSGTAVAGGTPAAVIPGTSPSPQASLQRFEVVGRLLRARMILGGSQPAVSNLTIEDDVRFLETQTAQPGEKPLMISGNRLDAVDVTAPTAAVTVVGQPAHFEGRGMGLTGPNINLNRGENRLWVDGAGQMDLPLPADPQGQSLVGPGMMTVTWQRRMDFDGRTATFTNAVVATTPQQQMRTETMLVRMQRPINFAQPNAQASPQVEEIQCCGGVAIENRSFDAQKQPTSYDRLQVTDLAVNVLSGAFTAGGPGWINSVQRGGGNNPLVASSPQNRTPVAATGAQDTLKCLNIGFQKKITGNLLQRHLTFTDHVRMTFAPAPNWDAMISTDNPDKLGPEGVVVRCDQLSVIQMLLPIGGRRYYELAAMGNTFVEGTTFTARGAAITYNEAKDWLILKGDGRIDADLFQQKEVGVEASKFSAQEIHYWPKTKRVNVINARALQINQPPNIQPKRPGGLP